MQIVLITLLLASKALMVASQLADYPPCVQTCLDENLSTTFCTGEETGAALDECTCYSLRGAPKVPCINQCPDEEKAVYKGRLPELCADEVIPGVSAAREGEEEAEEDDPEEEDPAVTGSFSTTASSTTASPTTTSPTATAETAATSTAAAAHGFDISAFVAVGGGLVAALAF